MDYLLIRLAVSIVGDTTDVDIPHATGEQVLQSGLNIVYGLAATIAIIVIIIGGIMYATSAGEPGNITKAKNMILYSVVGLVVVISAFAVTYFVLGRFG